MVRRLDARDTKDELPLRCHRFARQSEGNQGRFSRRRLNQVLLLASGPVLPVPFRWPVVMDRLLRLQPVLWKSARTKGCQRPPSHRLAEGRGKTRN